MLKNYVKYDKNTGAIICKLMIDHTLADIQCRVPEHALYEGDADEANDYFLNGVKTPRPVQSTQVSKAPYLADGTTPIVLTGMPAPCVVQIDETPYDVPSGLLEFTLDTPGVYTIRVQAFPYLEYTTQVEAL